MKPHTIILRLIALPFFATFALIGIIWQWIIICKNFVFYGGEAVAYTHANSKKTITDVYNHVKNNIQK